jgi:hypothetical protein
MITNTDCFAFPPEIKKNLPTQKHRKHKLQPRFGGRKTHIRVITSKKNVPLRGGKCNYWLALSQNKPLRISCPDLGLQEELRDREQEIADRSTMPSQVSRLANNKGASVRVGLTRESDINIV